MADGDVVTNENWLREIVSPLVKDPAIGVSTGNRWFIPPRPTIGALAAHLWNVAAISVMYHLSMPWGGCYAIRTSTIRRGGLIEKWAKVAALDMHTTNEMRQLGLKVHYVPSLMMVNRGTFSLPFAVNWIRRQLTWARLYNRAWPIIVLHTCVFVATRLAAAVLGPVCYYLGATSAAWWAIGGLGSYLVMLTGLTGLMEVRIRTRLRHAGQKIEAYSWWTSIPVFFVIPITQLVQLVAVLQATFLKRVAWRGSILEINGPNDIRVVDEEQPVLASEDGGTKAA
jgi:cellulose synthase/poly-beta-1,6-N-acetylglucosamine synthase-like glycosyltransferase